MLRPPCDCLNACGDDPRLRSGLVAICPEKLRRDRELAEIGERMYLQHSIAVDAAVRCIRFGTPSEWIDGLEHFRIDDPSRMTQPPPDVARAARFLLLSKRAIEPHPGVLRLVDPPTRRRTDRADPTTTGAPRP